MKVLIWFFCISLCSIFVVFLGYAGIRLGGIPTMLLYGGMWWTARTLCKKWDAHQAEKKVKATHSGENHGPGVSKEEIPAEHKDKPAFCRKCGKTLLENSRFCSKCGTTVEESIADTMRCASCDHAMPEDSDFCPYCGKEVEDNTAEDDLATKANSEETTAFEETLELSVSPKTQSDLNEVKEVKIEKESDFAVKSLPASNLEELPNNQEELKALLETLIQNAVNATFANRTTQEKQKRDPEFGLIPEKPIFTLEENSVEGQRAYLNCLRTLDGETVTWKRRGCTSVQGIYGMIDIYDTFLPSGEPYQTLYMDMYGEEKSEVAPHGFKLCEPSKASLNFPKAIDSKDNPDSKKASKRKVFCKKCGGQLDTKTRKCTQCGKRYFGFRLRYVLSFLLVALLLGAAYVGYNYYHFASLLKEQKFSAAQEYFNRIPYGETFLATEKEYLCAGLLMEQGAYTEALRAFEKIGGDTVPDSVTDSLKEKLYLKGTTEYYKENYYLAKYFFKEIGDYKHSEDFVLLIECWTRSVDFVRNQDKFIPGLTRLIYDNSTADYHMMCLSEDAKEMVLSNTVLLEKFLEGRWRIEAVKELSDYEKILYRVRLDADRFQESVLLYLEKESPAYGCFLPCSASLNKENVTASNCVILDIIDLANGYDVLAYSHEEGKFYRLYRQ